jgi:hypothetical protein
MDQKMEPACGRVSGVRVLTFPDGTQVGLIGLSGILEAMQQQGRSPDERTAAEIVEKLSAVNYIPTHSRTEYENLLLLEYRKFVGMRSRTPKPKETDEGEKRTGQTRGFFARLFRRLR